MGKAIAAIGVGLGAVLLWWYVHTSKGAEGSNDMTLVDKLRAASIPGEAASYLDDIVAAANDTVPSDYDGGAYAWAVMLIAVGMYESGFGTYRGYEPKGEPNGWGDNSNAFGFWQIDKHYHGAFIYGDDVSVRAQAEYAGKLLHDDWKYFAGYADQKGLMVAAYNASERRLKKLADSGASFEDIDATTTQRSGHGYATGVLDTVAEYTA